ncbi:hypothetical protein DFH07DRAFT_777291 [Mycena maculata]|uniref:Uncharacterized protein n=1 Tax=Mycena maculata TaxID=230809 RepID=A0AAD7N394_9AGAR|nr:hypothetical protein DFH07DRAFT_777291 [Mycena maculata]
MVNAKPWDRAWLGFGLSPGLNGKSIDAVYCCTSKLRFKMATRSQSQSPVQAPSTAWLGLVKPGLWLGQAGALAWSSRGFGLGAWGLKAKPSTSLVNGLQPQWFNLTHRVVESLPPRPMH